jgi:hypothetical protein
MSIDPTPSLPQRFEFDFDPMYERVGRLFGVHPGNAWVEIAEDGVEARFGHWVVRTEPTNVAAVTVSGPYSRAKTIGPAHLSLRDRGLTFATNHRSGVCLEFDEPVPGMDPVGVLRHPGLTVTVADPLALIAAIGHARVLASAGDDAEEVDDETQAAEDQLHLMTASELRALAADRGISHPSSIKKADLVVLLEASLGDELVERLGQN